MLATRIIPTLLCRGRQLIKGQRFNAWRPVGVVTQAVRIHQMRKVDELMLLDIAATPENRGPDLDLITELAKMFFSPLTIGGGIKTLDDIRDVLRSGADKVAIRSAATVDFIKLAADKFGSQAITVAIDSGITPKPVDTAKQCQIAGAGEILLTSVEREGMMNGYDFDLIKQISMAVDIPVIAHGGCGTYEHMYEAIQAGAHAVAAGAMFQFTDQTPSGAALYLQSKGIRTRVQ